MPTIVEAEIGLANIDDCIADADSNIRRLGDLIAQLEHKGYPTAEIERDLTQLMKVLHGVRAQRRTIVNALDGVEPQPRIARPRNRVQRRTGIRAVATKAASAGGSGIWRIIYQPFSRPKAIPARTGRPNAQNNAQN